MLLEIKAMECRIHRHNSLLRPSVINSRDALWSRMQYIFVWGSILCAKHEIVLC